MVKEPLAARRGFFYLGAMRAIAIIPAAGRSTRFGGDIPKQYALCHGRPVYEHTLARFEAAGTIAGVMLVVAAERVEAVRASLSKRFPKILAVVAGGRTRQASVANGFRAIADSCDVVVVHDVARPLVTPGLIDRCVEVAAQCGAAIVACQASDTVKRVKAGGAVDTTLPREMIWLAQTPQAARWDLFHRALTQAEASGFVGTDEAALLEAIGERVTIVAGSKWNVKITTPEDLAVAEALLKVDGL